MRTDSLGLNSACGMGEMIRRAVLTSDAASILYEARTLNNNSANIVRAHFIPDTSAAHTDFTKTVGQKRIATDAVKTLPSRKMSFLLHRQSNVHRMLQRHSRSLGGNRVSPRRS